MAAKNFMCFGPKGIEIFFEDYGNIVLIQGINLDTGTRNNVHSNGSGKTSIIDVISYAIYGKTVKKPKKIGVDDVIHNQVDKGLEVELIFDDYRIVRKRGPNSLHVWQSKDGIWDEATDVTKGTAGETQKFIEGIIGLSHAAFCAVVVIDDSGKHTFLELDKEGKRSVVENILDLDCYREYQENAKEFLKENKKQVKELTDKYSRCSDAIDEINKKAVEIQTQEKNWIKAKNDAIATIKKNIETKQQGLLGLDKDGILNKYEEAQAKIQALKKTIVENEEKKSKVDVILAGAKTKQTEALLSQNQVAIEAQTLTSQLTELGKKKTEHEGTMKDLSSLKDGVLCDKCMGPISKANYGKYLELTKNKLEKVLDEISKGKASAELLKKQVDEKKASLEAVNKSIGNAETIVKDISSKNFTMTKDIEALNKIQKPDLSVAQTLLENDISMLKTQLEEKEKESAKSPYKEILESTLASKVAKQAESDLVTAALREQEKLTPYGEFFVSAFGDTGIRKDVIDGVIPSLNESIDSWLECLIDGKYKVVLNSELQENVHIGEIETDYNALSNGEKTRTNIAISQGWGYVGTLSAGKVPSISFLDEITGGGIDVAGVAGIYRIILELSKERQVFLTTHNQTLIDMLQGCKTITLVKQNGVSSIEK